MQLPGKTVQANMERIKDSVEWAQQYFQENITSFNAFTRFIFKDTFTPEDDDRMTELQLPKLRCNVIEPFVSRLRGEFAQNHPDLKIFAPNSNDPGNAQMIPVVSGILRNIMYHSNSEDIDNETITNMLAGGYHVLRVDYDYDSDDTLDQSLNLSSVYDPTLCGFDPEAIKKHKGDGRFCYTFYPKRLSEIQQDYPNNQLISSLNKMPFAKNPNNAVDWTWTDSKTKEKMVLVCEYFEKVYKQVKFVKLMDNSTVTSDEYEQMVKDYEENQTGMPMVKPEIMGKPVNKKVVDRVDRYLIAGDMVLEYDKTIFTDLPLIFFDGNGKRINNRHMTRSYVYNVKDVQRARNFLFNQFIDETQNIRKTTILAPKAAIPDEGPYRDAYLNPAKAQAALVYEHELVDDMTNEVRQIPPPQVFPRAPIPPELFQAFVEIKDEIQSQLGAYDAQLGIQDMQLSGKAIIAGSTQANAAAKPYLINYIASMNQVARILLKLIPEVYNTPRTIPIVMPDGKRAYQQINQPNGMNLAGLEPNALDIIIEEGVNFEIERQQAVQDLVNLSQAFPALGQVINSPQGLSVLLDNLNFRGVETLKEMVDQQANQPPQPPQPNPALIKAQASMVQAQTEQQRLSMEQQQSYQDLMMEQQKLQAKIANDQQQAQLTADRQQLERVNQQLKNYQFVTNHVHQLHKEHQHG